MKSNVTQMFKAREREEGVSAGGGEYECGGPGVGHGSPSAEGQSQLPISCCTSFLQLNPFTTPKTLQKQAPYYSAACPTSSDTSPSTRTRSSSRSTPSARLPAPPPSLPPDTSPSTANQSSNPRLPTTTTTTTSPSPEVDDPAAGSQPRRELTRRATQATTTTPCLPCRTLERGRARPGGRGPSRARGRGPGIKEDSRRRSL